MRNKEKFLEDVKQVITPGVLDDEQIIEDAAHTMPHLGQNSYTLTPAFTTTGTSETFNFEQKMREATDGGADVLDYFYVGKER